MTTEAAPATAPLVLFTRSYCHLCHDMEAVVRPLAAAFDVALELVDVDSSEQLEALYGERVPVLRHGHRELCHYFVDADALHAYLAGISQKTGEQDS